MIWRDFSFFLPSLPPQLCVKSSVFYLEIWGFPSTLVGVAARDEPDLFVFLVVLFLRYFSLSSFSLGVVSPALQVSPSIF